MAEPSDMESLSFEEAFQQLEETVKALEQGNLALEEAVGLFERGMKLAQVCSAKLDSAELHIKQLMVGPEGISESVPFEPE